MIALSLMLRFLALIMLSRLQARCWQKFMLQQDICGCWLHGCISKKRWTNRSPVMASRLPAGHQRASLVIRDNLRNRHSIERCYLRSIAAARREIILANAYFLPGKHFRQALARAAQRGVSVILLLQGKSEYRLQHYAMHALYGHLLDAGISIYEYRMGICTPRWPLLTVPGLLSVLPISTRSVCYWRVRPTSLSVIRYLRWNCGAVCNRHWRSLTRCRCIPGKAARESSVR